MDKPITFVATGDSFITRRLVKNEEFKELQDFINTGDVRFTNLEVTVHNYEGYPGAVSGGTWAIVSPNALDDIKDYGFNILNWANNHTLDYLYGGLEATQRNIEERGFIHVGVGKNLAEANSPKYLETDRGRVAFIGVTSTFNCESWIAGDQRPDMVGRPGINPLRIKTTYTLRKGRIDQLREIAAITEINAYQNLMIKEGFSTEKSDGSFTFGNYSFVEGDKEGITTEPLEKDMNRVLRAIDEAKRQADYVFVSVHSHEMKGEDKSAAADFLKEFSRKCIDGGAHGVIGHGPHILRGIEIYKNRPIFYSLGNFVFQNDTVEKLPADFYEKYGLAYSNNIADALDTRSQNNTKGLGVNKDVWVSVIPRWTMKNGELETLELHPIELGYGLHRYRMGIPKFSKDIGILEKLQQLCEPFGTKVRIEGTTGIVELSVSPKDITL